jgi:hypothetical protein
MIEVGDLVRAKNRSLGMLAGVFLVLEKGEGRRGCSDSASSMMALCAQGSKKIWLYVRHLEKL